MRLRDRAYLACEERAWLAWRSGRWHRYQAWSFLSWLVDWLRFV